MWSEFKAFLINGLSKAESLLIVDFKTSADNSKTLVLIK